MRKFSHPTPPDFLPVNEVIGFRRSKLEINVKVWVKV